MNFHGGRVTGAAAALVGVLAVVFSLRLDEDTLSGGPGPWLLPVSLGLIVAVLGAVIALRRVPARTREASDSGARLRVAGTLGGVALYAVAFERVGFVVSSVVFVAALLVFYGERRWPVVLTVAVAGAAATYVVFAWWLGVPLPPGVIPTW